MTGVLFNTPAHLILILRGKCVVYCMERQTRDRESGGGPARGCPGLLAQESNCPPRTTQTNTKNTSQLVRIFLSTPSGSRPSRAVPLSVLQVLHAAQVPFGVPDPYPADPTHPSAWYTCRAGSQPAISPIPCPWHHARPTCAWRHVRSTFNLSRCLCASLCMCNTWLLHVQMGWACLDWR